MNQKMIPKDRIARRFNEMARSSNAHYMDHFKRFRYIFNYLDADTLNTAMDRAQFIEDHFAELPSYFPEEWFELLTTNDRAFSDRVECIVFNRKADCSVKN